MVLFLERSDTRVINFKLFPEPARCLLLASYLEGPTTTGISQHILSTPLATMNTMTGHPF